jgi:hypothetical protein
MQINPNIHLCAAASPAAMIKHRRQKLDELQSELSEVQEGSGSKLDALQKVFNLHEKIKSTKSELKLFKIHEFISRLNTTSTEVSSLIDEYKSTWLDDEDFEREFKKNLESSFIDTNAQSNTLKNLYKFLLDLNQNEHISDLYQDPKTRKTLFELLSKSQSKTEDLPKILDVVLVNIQAGCEESMINDRISDLIKELKDTAQVEPVFLNSVIINRIKGLTESMNETINDSDYEDLGPVLILDPNDSSPIQDRYYNKINTLEAYQTLIFYLIKNSERNLRAPLFKTFIDSFKVSSSEDTEPSPFLGKQTINFESLGKLAELDLTQETLLSKELIEKGLMELIDFGQPGFYRDSINQRLYQRLYQSLTVLETINPKQFQKQVLQIIRQELEDEQFPAMGPYIRYKLLNRIDPKYKNFKELFISSFNQQELKISDQEGTQEDTAYWNAKTLVDISLLALENKNKDISDIEKTALSEIIESNRKLLVPILLRSDNFIKFLHNYIYSDPNASLVLGDCLNEQLKKKLIDFYIKNPKYIESSIINKLPDSSYKSWITQDLLLSRNDEFFSQLGTGEINLDAN